MAVAQVSDQDQYFSTRLPFDRKRAVLWRSLYRFSLRRFIKPSDCVLDLGCGYGDFINAVVARRRIAVDLWEGAASHLAPGVEHHVGSVTDLAFLAPGSVDVAFASNVFEHLEQQDFSRVLSQLSRILSAGGRLIVIQPNYRYAFKEYFDDYTHVAVYSHVSLSDLLAAHGFRVTVCVPRFMPLTVKSRFSVRPALIWAYLHSPVKPLGKQMLIVAERPAA
jgi:SAM-dependent methyltransferase